MSQGLSSVCGPLVLSIPGELLSCPLGETQTKSSDTLSLSLLCHICSCFGQMMYFLHTPFIWICEPFLPLSETKAPYKWRAYLFRCTSISVSCGHLCSWSQLEEFYPHHTGPNKITFQAIWETWGEASGCALPCALHDVRLFSICAT